jgi:hypothetical protein
MSFSNVLDITSVKAGWVRVTVIVEAVLLGIDLKSRLRGDANLKFLIL